MANKIKVSFNLKSLVDKFLEDKYLYFPTIEEALEHNDFHKLVIDNYNIEKRINNNLSIGF